MPGEYLGVIITKRDQRQLQEFEPAARAARPLHAYFFNTEAQLGTAR